MILFRRLFHSTFELLFKVACISSSIFFPALSFPSVCCHRTATTLINQAPILECCLLVFYKAKTSCQKDGEGKILGIDSPRHLVNRG